MLQSWRVLLQPLAWPFLNVSWKTKRLCCQSSCSTSRQVTVSSSWMTSLSRLRHVRKSLKTRGSKQRKIFILTLGWWSNMVTCKLQIRMHVEASSATMDLSEIFTTPEICLRPKWYTHPIFNNKSRKSTAHLDCDFVSINVLICVILNMIASSWSFSQNPPIMTR